MDRVTEETASPQISEVKRGRNNTTDHSIRASQDFRTSINRASYRGSSEGRNGASATFYSVNQ